MIDNVEKIWWKTKDFLNFRFRTISIFNPRRKRKIAQNWKFQKYSVFHQNFSIFSIIPINFLKNLAENVENFQIFSTPHANILWHIFIYVWGLVSFKIFIRIPSKLVNMFFRTYTIWIQLQKFRHANKNLTKSRLKPFFRKINICHKNVRMRITKNMKIFDIFR